MKLDAKDIKVEDCLTVGKYVEKLREKTGNDKISNSTIHHHLDNTDNLDYVEFCGLKLIVQNDKAANFTPGNYYGKATRSMKKIQL